MVKICTILFKEIVRSNFAKLIYPTYQQDWYKNKGYNGISHQERFNDFVSKQKIPGSIYFKEFKSLKLTRKFVTSSGFQIDSVKMKPSKLLSKNKPGDGLYIVFFLGRSEYYESRFRDMALFAQNTGATIVGFNPKGFNSSSGETKILFDIVDDGIAIVESLIACNISPKQIVFYGNSIGAIVQEMVCKHFRKLKLADFRQINSNSFSSLASVFSTNMRMRFLKNKIMKLMKYADWEIDYAQNFYKTGVMRCFLSRKGDEIIKKEASFCSKINRFQDIIDAPEEYRETLNWLNNNSELITISPNKKDPHILSLYNMFLKTQDENGRNFTVWYFINRYLDASNKFV